MSAALINSNVIGNPYMFGTYLPSAHGIGLNLFGGMPGGQFIDQAISMQLNSLLQSRGYSIGSFNPSQNAFDQFLSQQYSAAQLTAMRSQRAFENDSARLSQFMTRGYSMITGNTPTDAQKAMIGGISSNVMQYGISTLAPLYPTTVDEIFGLKGSSSLFNMGLAQGSRFLTDPRPGGGFGSFATADGGAKLGDFGAAVFKRLYENQSDMRGIGGTAAGQMFTQMTQRGLLSDKDFNVEGVTTKLKSMSKAVSAMRDIFGDLGKADAPMLEIMNGLEALTQGALQRFDATKVATLVRNTQYMAKQAGVGMDAVMGMQSSVVSQLGAMGADSSFANPIVQQSLATATAYGAIEGGNIGFRRFSKEQVMALDQTLRAGAAGSQVAKQAAVLMRMRDLGLLTGKDGKNPGKELADEFAAGNFSRLNFMSTQDLAKLLTDSGVDAQTAGNAVMNPAAAEEFIRTYNLDQGTRARQADLELTPILQNLVSAPINLALEKKVSAATRNKITQGLPGFLFSELSPEDRGDPVKRNKAIAAFIRRQMTPEEVAKAGSAAEGLAASLVGQLEETYRPTAYGGLQNLLALHYKPMLAKQGMLAREAGRQAEVADIMAGLGTSGPLRRVMEAIVAPGATGESVAASFFGGDQKATLMLDESQEKFRKANLLEAEILKLGNDLEKASPEEKKEILDKIEKNKDELRKIMHGPEGLIENLKNVGMETVSAGIKKRKAIQDIARSSKMGTDAGANLLAGITGKREDIAKRVRARLGKTASEEDVAKEIEKEERGLSAVPTADDLLGAELIKGGHDDLSKLVGSDKAKIMREKGISLREMEDALNLEKSREDAVQKMTIDGTLKVINGEDGVVNANGMTSISGPAAKPNTK